ncbi:hypothetical protein [Nitrosopumilus sp. Nsub]|uniref:hypothetical protein n=1 Tax=Nitrosopumilus sp. Nsub TaxID=1776294 RepID=UPI0008360A3A|nr:hypothetical protein [Nitrosopumilus sp. Nsub]
MIKSKNFDKKSTKDRCLNKRRDYHYNDHIVPYKKLTNAPILVPQNIPDNIQIPQFQLQYSSKQLLE